MKFSSGLGVRTRCVCSSLRARRARFEFSFGERRRGLRNVDVDNANAFLDTLALLARRVSPLHHKAEDQRTCSPSVFYLGRKDSEPGYCSLASSTSESVALALEALTIGPKEEAGPESEGF